MSLGLSSSDYAALSTASGVNAEILARRLVQVRLQDFKAPELREILKFLRAHTAFQTNPFCGRTPGGISGKKAQLQELLRNVLTFQTQTQGGTTPYQPQQPPPPQQQPYDPQSAAAASGMGSAAHLQQQQAYRGAMQAVQQQRTYGALPQDPYGRYGASAPAAARPVAPAPHAYGYQQAPAAAAQQQQQFAYTNGSSGAARDYTQYASAQQRSMQPQSHMQPGANGYAHQQHPHQQQQQQQQQYGYAQAAAAAPIPAAPSVPSAATKAHEINALVTHPEFSRNRSPYEQTTTSLARNLLNAHSHIGSGTTVQSGGTAYHTTLQFNIGASYLPRLKRLGARVHDDAEQIQVHLRLFSSLPPAPAHTAWDKKFRVQVNGHEVPIPEPRKLSKTKKKGLELVRALDVSEYCNANNTVEVSVYRQSYQVELFRGLVTADLVRIRPTEELLLEMEGKRKELESKRQAMALQRHCVICKSTKDPLRCSRCKSEWYCGLEHQRSHWPTHRDTCQAPTPQQDAEREATEKRAAQLAMLGPNGRTKLVMPVRVKDEASAAGAAADDDEIEEGVEEVDSLVSLRCPLSIERYAIPARGRHCAHLTCFDLKTFLEFSQQSGVWQCPLCYKPLTWEDLEIDLNMLSVIRETEGQEVSQIRVHPDGQYDVISNQMEGESGDGREPRKRKQPSASPTNVPTQPPAQRQALGTGPTPIHNGDFSSSSAGDPAAAQLGHFPSPHAASSAAAAAAPAPAPSPTSGGAAGTADEPIELD